MIIRLLIVLGVLGLTALLLAAPFWFDRFSVRVIRQFNLPVYQTAVMIALSIVQRPDEWECTAHDLHHKLIGTIWTSNRAYGLHVQTGVGRWNPNFIERRIIYEAVDWRLRTFIRQRIQQTMLSSQTGRIIDAD